MLEFDPERVARNAQEATSEDLLDRITVYRDGMEAAAVEIIEAELRRRYQAGGNRCPCCPYQPSDDFPPRRHS